MSEEDSEEVVTLTFENAANENKKWQIASLTAEQLRDYVGRAAKQLFTPVPQRVGIATKDGAIVQNWADSTVKQVIDQYHTNHFVIGTPDQLGVAPLFLKRDNLSDHFIKDRLDGQLTSFIMKKKSSKEN